MKRVALDILNTKTTKKGTTLLVVGFFLLTSLLSYNNNDNCINTIGTTKTHNLLGIFGATTADVLFQLFGFGVFFCLPFLFFVAIKFVCKQKIEFIKFKIVYTTLVVLYVCFLLNCINGHQNFFSLLFGGYIGYIISVLLSTTISKVIFGLVGLPFLLFYPYSVFVFNGIDNNVKNIKKTLKKNNKRFFVAKFLLYFIKKTTATTKFITTILIHPFVSLCLLFRRKKNKTKTTIKKKTNQQKTETQLSNYVPPVPSLLKLTEKQNHTQNQILCRENMTKLSQTLGEFGVRGEIVGYKPGPIVTLYEFKPQAGVKASRVIGLADDIARTMMVASVRTATISGRDTLGIEVPNKTRDIVCFRRLIESQEYENTGAKIPMILGCNIFGRPIVADLTDMPHLLIAGTTGSGKSVGINGMILSMLYKLSPQECKLIMIDPKMLEFSAYDGIPHLLLPIITDAKNAILALKWVVSEMEKRYKMLSEAGVRNIVGFNEKIEQKKLDDEKLPYVVVVIDEMADLMVVAKKEIEVLVQRIAQMARAAGIHLITATQRPSVDVITGVIKANFPTRISYHVTSKIDSRTILGEQGAEQLLGKGDLLFMLGGVKSLRVHGPLITDEEVENVVNYIKKNNPKPEYIELINEDENEDFDGDFSGGFNSGFNNNNDNLLYKQAVKIVLTEKKSSISYLQRKLRIGYNKSANFIEKMEQDGILSSPDPSGKRIILKNTDNF